MRFVIIGGDAAGMSAASRAKRNRPDLEVVVLEQGGDVSYSACGMPYNIADPSREMEELVVRRAEVFREKQGIDLRLGHRAEAVEPEGQTVRGTTREGKSFELSYDHLLIATGASPVRPDLPGMDLPGVMELKSLEHGRRIKAFLREAGGGPVVIVGMGYIALEMAEAFRALALEVSMVKPRPTLLPWMAAPLRERVKKELQDQGVRLYPGVRIQAIEGKGRELTVRCEDINLPARLVLVAVGVRPNSRLAKEAGLLLGPQESIARPGSPWPLGPTGQAMRPATMSRAEGPSFRVWPVRPCSRSLTWRWPARASPLRRPGPRAWIRWNRSSPPVPGPMPTRVLPPFWCRWWRIGTPAASWVPRW